MHPPMSFSLSLGQSLQLHSHQQDYSSRQRPWQQLHDAWLHYSPIPSSRIQTQSTFEYISRLSLSGYIDTAPPPLPNQDWLNRHNNTQQPLASRPRVIRIVPTIRFGRHTRTLLGTEESSSSQWSYPVQAAPLLSPR